MNMESSNIPVSYDFFKKYTHHEEWVDTMFKAKAKGNQQIYNALSKSPESKEKALRSYYEAFYLRPEIREKYHIRIKAVPKCIKDKLLQIPVRDTQTNKEKSNENNPQSTPMQELVTSDVVGIARDIMGEVFRSESIENKMNAKLKQLAQGADLNDQEIEDDNEQTRTSSAKTKNLPTIESNIQLKDSLQLAEQQSNTKEIPDREYENMFQKYSEDSTNQQSKEKVSPTQTAKHGKSPVNYKDLIPYLHCCPVSYKDFRKYSNIKKLVEDFCIKKQLDKSEQRKVLYRSYILFYLAPEHRTTNPINKIQLLENCPAQIRDTFFNIPTNLYLNQQQENEENEKFSKEQSIPHYEANNTEKIPSFNEQNTSFNKSNNDQSLPVAFEDFKKYTHYEQVIDNLFKSVAHDNEDIYWKYKHSQEAFNSTLKNYYRAFYLIPVVREKFPIEFKAIPKSLKCRLLQIPEGAYVTDFTNIRAEQLVLPELNVFVDIKKEQIDAADEGMEESNLRAEHEATTQLLSKENKMECTDSGTKIKSSLQANKNKEFCAAKTQLVVKENVMDCIDLPLQNSKKPISLTATGIKRSPQNDIEQPSRKRLKDQIGAQQTEAFSEICEKTKKSIKDLLPYTRCCPVTFSQFQKYTNITQLFTGYCQSRYKDLKKLPYMVKRAYILYYLAPENRKYRPFSNLKLTDDCPQPLKETIFKIPTNFNEDREKHLPELLLKKETNSETQHLLEQQTSLTRNNPKNTIEILENRLLPPTALSLTNQISSSESAPSSLNCCNSNCIFHFISHNDFMQKTNILQILPQPHDVNIVKKVFKKFIYQIIKENNCDDIYVHGNLLIKILKHQHICENCESAIVDLINKDTAEGNCNESEPRSQIEHNENIVENRSDSSERLQNMEINTVDAEREQQEKDESLTISEEENLPSNIKVQTNVAKINSKRQSTDDLVEFLKKEKIFQKFRQKLFTKLNQCFDNTVIDLSSETYNIFTQCNEIPLRQILKDFCPTHEDILERILNDKELSDVLERYYYCQYLTNSNFATKYPVHIKQLEEHSNVANEHNSEILKRKMETKEFEVRNKVIEAINNNTNDNPGNSRNLEDIDAFEINSQTSKKHKTDNKAFEKAKRIFFRNFDRTDTLSYVVRTSFGLKQLILRYILCITYEEFLKLTKVYQGQSLYNDSHVAECMYRFVFQTPTVWPTNLYITLQDLYNYLYDKNIRFGDFSNMLAYISPKLLHWSDLMSCTTIEQCVKIDYEKRTGKSFNSNDENSLAHECNEYYNRCWKHEKWLHSVPLIYINYVGNNNSHQTDVTELNDSALQTNSEQQSAQCTTQYMSGTSCCQQENSANKTTLNLQSINSEIEPDHGNIQTTIEVNTSSSPNRSIAEFNCILLPNTQQQINMLPTEVSVTKDPLNNSFSGINLNETSSANENYVVTSLGEIKTEPDNEKLLRNLLFYEDDESNMQCMPCEDEILNLDETISQSYDNLPPSQLQFDEVIPQRIFSDDLVASDKSNSTLNLAQCLPSSIGSNDSTLCSQQFVKLQNRSTVTSTQRLLPDVSLSSSGENEIQQQQPQRIVNRNKVEQHPEPFMGEEEMVNIDDKSPNTIEELSNNLHSSQNSSESAALTVHTLLNRSSMENIPSSSTANTDKSLTIQQANNTSHYPAVDLPISKYVKPAAKINRNVAKVRPLKNYDLVPQIHHHARPLSIKPLYPTGSSKNEGTPAVLLQNCTPTESSIIQTTTTTLRISQELNTNCSVFNNSSLLRIVDHNYHQEPLTKSPSIELHRTQAPQNVNLAINTPLRESHESSPHSSISHRISVSSEKNSSQEIRNKTISNLTTIAEVDAQSSPRTTNHSNIVYKNNNNDKVNNNNDPLTPRTNNNKNLVATVLPIRHHPCKFIYKQSLFRHLLKFHYFKKLKTQHIREYLLPSIEIDKSYMEATVVSENFKSRLTNKSISSIFRFWPRNVQQDFLLVLNNLNEFHYFSFERNSLKNDKDLRVRILYWLLNTAPSFALCQFIFEGNNTEFARCETVHNGNNLSYKRKPFTSLTEALDIRLLDRIKDLKRNC